MIVPGRVFILHLRGPLGNLDIECIYLDAGTHPERQASIHKLARAIRPQHSTLSVLLGDSNFVCDNQGRWSGMAQKWAVNGDLDDAKLLDEMIAQPFGFVEFEQDHYTCHAKGAYSRLDRVYQNQHLSAQLDRVCKSTALEWCEDLSAHRPVGTYRYTSKGKVLTQTPMQPWVFKHGEFASRVNCEFHDKCRIHPGRINAVSKLLICKEAIKSVHDHMVGSLTVVEARSTEDRLGWTIMCARHLEKRQYDLVEHDMECYPELKTRGKNAVKLSSYLSEPELAHYLKQVKDHAVELAREDIGNDIANLRASGSGESNERIQQKEHILKKLRRLSPGETNQLKCLVDDEGNLHTDAKNMAKALCKHWREVFCKVPCDDSKFREWMDILFEKSGDARWNTGLPTDPNAWKIRRSHIVKAVKQATNSMPGPDGIPAMAYKAMGDMMIDLLEDMIGVLLSAEAEDVLTEAFSCMTLEERHAFNASILCCLPKKPSGVDDEAGEFYHAEATRPLNISNVDNRLLASAARLAWEPKFKEWISAMQRGFLKGRQMLHNVLDVDFEAMRVSLKTEHGLLVLFDFRAAFPSVSHEFLISCLRYLGLPAYVMNFIRIMYNNNWCTIRIQGEDFPGFMMEGGVRQGCPLSPLLFAVCVDLLLRRLQHDIPGIIVRAFADDIASVVRDWWSHGPAMDKLFSEFASISSLCLNIMETVCMPLWPKGAAELKESLATLTPSWAEVRIDSKGTYLGFVVGPGSTNLSWVKPLDKFQVRVRQWSKLGKGMQFGAMAYNTFALSTLLFIAQLESIPCEVSASERKHVIKMFPGFGHWIEPSEVWYMKEMFGCAQSAQPLEVIAKASKLRMAILGCHFDRTFETSPSTQTWP